MNQTKIYHIIIEPDGTARQATPEEVKQHLPQPKVELEPGVTWANFDEALAEAHRKLGNKDGQK